MLDELMQQLVNGLALGSIYALVALGYTMVYGIVKLINFAHGDILMIGAFSSYFALFALGEGVWGIALAFIFAMLVSALSGVVIEKLAYKPLRNSPRINVLITAIGVSLLLQNLARVLPFIGPNPKEFPTINTVNLSLGTITISNVQILVIGISVFLMIVLNFIITKTKTGRAMRSVSYDYKAASLMGVNVNRIISYTFAIGSALAAAAGMLFALAYPQIDPYMGTIPGLKAFIAAVLGGIGSIPGAMIGGYILGIAETLTKGFISSKLADAISFGILIVILLAKPTGIMGKNIKEKV